MEFKKSKIRTTVKSTKALNNIFYVILPSNLLNDCTFFCKYIARPFGTLFGMKLVLACMSVPEKRTKSSCFLSMVAGWERTG